jgi:hypothetical protein
MVHGVAIFHYFPLKVYISHTSIRIRTNFVHKMIISLGIEMGTTGNKRGWNMMTIHILLFDDNIYALNGIEQNS